MKLRLVEEDKICNNLSFFEKEFEEGKPTGYFTAVDYNADNVSLGNNNFLIQVRTELGRLTRFYSDVRTRIQETILPVGKENCLLKKGENSSRNLDIGR